MRLRLLLATLGLTVLAAAPAQAACSGADVTPTTTAQASTAATATLCLVNEERARVGRRPLRAGAVDIAGIAFTYAKQMASGGFVGHTGLDGGTLDDRLTGLRWKDHWSQGEDVGFGFVPNASPAGMVAGFMTSPHHRANILSADYNELGIGVAPGLAVAGTPLSAAYVLDFLGRDPVVTAKPKAKKKTAVRKRKKKRVVRRAGA